MTTTEESALVGQILTRPADDTPRLVYADWLDEHGQADRAEFVRVQCAIAVEFAATTGCVCRAAEDKFHCDWCLAWDQTERLRERERSLLDSTYHTAHPDLPTVMPGWSVFPGTWAAKHHYTPSGSLAVTRRGFVDEIRLRQGPFQKLAADIFCRHPITQVSLFDRVPYASPRYGDGIPGPMLTPDRFNFGWCDHPVLTPGTSHIGPRLWRLLPADRAVEIHQHFRFYRTREAAHAALSAACVAYGRELVGLPPLE